MKTTKSLLALSALLSVACASNTLKSDASGIFEATEVIVSAQGSGELLQFDIEEGDQMIEGQKIGYIDTVQLHLRKVQLQSSLSSIESRRADVAVQIAATKEQIATQKREQKRFENLVRTDAANQKQLDDINSQLAVLERQLSAQKENLENGNRGVSAESSSLRAQISQIEDQIAKCVIMSPINGTVLAKYAEQNEYAAAGRSLFKIADIDTMKLRAYITADQLNSLKVGQRVNVYADKGTDGYSEHAGTVIWIADKAEFTPKTIQTRDERANLVYAIKIATPNDGYIKKGMYGEVKFSAQ